MNCVARDGRPQRDLLSTPASFSPKMTARAKAEFSLDCRSSFGVCFLLFNKVSMLEPVPCCLCFRPGTTAATEAPAGPNKGRKSDIDGHRDRINSANPLMPVRILVTIPITVELAY